MITGSIVAMATPMKAGGEIDWEALRRLGHREEVEEWVKAGYPALMREPVPVGRLADYDLPYQTPG